MYRTRVFSSDLSTPASLKLLNFGDNCGFPDNDTTRLLKLVYDGYEGDISLYLNPKTRPEIRQAIENLLTVQQPLDKYPDDVMAFDMLPHEFETKEQYQNRLQSIINESYNNSLNNTSND